MADVTRRRVLTVGAAGAAGLATTTVAGKVQANTQKPVAPKLISPLTMPEFL